MRTEKLYNPFYPWTKDMLNALMEAGHKYFVRQSFNRGLTNETEDVKAVIIVSHYNDRHQAEAHLAAVSRDPWASLYDISVPEQREKLSKTVEAYKEYRFFSNTAAPDWQSRFERYESTFRSYIETVIKWQPKGKDTVWVGLHSNFGELYVTFKYLRDTVRVKISEIENHNLCATTSPFSLRLNWLPNTYHN